MVCAGGRGIRHVAVSYITESDFSEDIWNNIPIYPERAGLSGKNCGAAIEKVDEMPYNKNECSLEKAKAEAAGEESPERTGAEEKGRQRFK